VLKIQTEAKEESVININDKVIKVIFIESINNFRLSFGNGFLGQRNLPFLPLLTLQHPEQPHSYRKIGE
jgi:hypothetical protein